MIPESELMAQARRARGEGRLDDMQSILVNVVVQEPNNDEAWLMLAETIQDPEKKMECLERARRIDPRNPATQRAIQQLRDEIAQAAFGPELAARSAEASVTTKEQTEETSAADVVVEIPIQPELAGPLLDYAETLAKSIMLSVEPVATRALGHELVQLVEQAMRHDEMRARRWVHSAGRDALVKYEKTLTTLITNLPHQDSQLPALRQARQRTLNLLK